MALKKADIGRELGLSPDEVAALRRAERKMAPRLLIMVACFMAANYLDRTNLALASVELTAALGLTPATYGLGASLFYASFCVLQIPSQMLFAYIRRSNLYMAGLLVAWGAVAAGTAGMKTIPQFLALRVLLGTFEAGATPALWTYLSHFYGKERLAVPYSVLMGTIVLSQAAGPLLAAGLLSMNGLGGLAGWQWLFLIEGLLAILVAIGWLFMPHEVDSIAALTPAEAAAVHASMARTHKPARGGNQLAVLAAALRNPVVHVLAVIKCTRDIVMFGLLYWAPMIVESILGYNSFEAPAQHAATATGAGGTPAAKSPASAEGIRVVLLVAVPFTAAGTVQFVNAWHSQRTNERRFHLAGSWMFGAVCLLLLPLALRSFAAGFAVLVLATIGTFGAEGILPAHFMALQGGEKGLGMAFINSAGAVGGFVGPLVIGAIKQSSGSYSSAMYALGAFLAFAAALTAAFDPRWAERWMLQTKAAAGGDVEMAGGGDGGGGGGGGGGKVVVDARGAA